ncbi:MAG: hypothetical protein NTY77_05920 [Elusimicrobia bacterium]|nr:hypothetical protein [Elusimicrobiota bacterium]
MIGTIGRVGDQDWYRIDVPEAGPPLRAQLSLKRYSWFNEFEVNATGVPGLALMLSLKRYDGSPASCDPYPWSVQVENRLGPCDAFDQGTYFLVVSEATGKAAKPASTYTLNKKLIVRPMPYYGDWESLDNTKPPSGRQ